MDQEPQRDSAASSRSALRSTSRSPSPSSSATASRHLPLGLAAATLALLLAAACSKSAPAVQPTPTFDPPGEPADRPAAAAPAPPPVPDQDLDSKEVLSRTELADEADVKHVLVAWRELEDEYNGQLDPRAKGRSNAEAAKLALEIAAQLRARPDDIDALARQHSEDPVSLEGTPYRVAADSPFVPEFKNLSLRLKEKEVGIVRTRFGYHVIERVPPPPPDPLESADILARAPGKGPVLVRHVLIGWKDLPNAQQRTLDPRAQQRTKADADQLATQLLAKVRKGADILKLMKELSEDPGSAASGRAYPVEETTPFVPPFKHLALRLKLGEAGLVKTEFGWHVIKRVPPPPLDKLESRAILARKPVAEKVTVKHVLLGWSETHATDPRGEKRTRAELEALVKKTLASLQKGAPIEPIMQELSEDPGSASSGQSYDVTPEAGLVAPFKNLSLRLKPSEVGVVKTDFGMHIIQRVPDAPTPTPTP